MGDGAVASGFGSTAIGQNSTASGTFATALGTGASASGTGATAVGHNASASGSFATAIGTSAKATGSGATAMGNNANASGFQSVALGQNSLAAAFNSVAIGAGSIATRSNTVSVGAPGAERQITNVAPGTFGTDAVNVSQLTTAVTSLSNQIGSVRDEERRGIAAATASAFVPTPQRPGGTTWALNGSIFENQGGFGIAFAHRLAWTTIPIYVSGAWGNGGGKENVGRFGISGEF
jgi:autotransporter adhesin